MLARVSHSNLSLQAHPAGVMAVREFERRVDCRKSIDSKQKLPKRRGGTREIAVNETSLSFRNPHPEAFASPKETKPEDALQRTGNLTIRGTLFWVNQVTARVVGQFPIIRRKKKGR